MRNKEGESMPALRTIIQQKLDKRIEMILQEITEKEEEKQKKRGRM